MKLLTVTLTKNFLEACFLLKSINFYYTSFMFYKFVNSFCKVRTESQMTLSGLRQYLANEIPLKIMKNFYFTLKALFVLKIFKFLS